MVSWWISPRFKGLCPGFWSLNAVTPGAGSVGCRDLQLPTSGRLVNAPGIKKISMEGQFLVVGVRALALPCLLISALCSLQSTPNCLSCRPLPSFVCLYSPEGHNWNWPERGLGQSCLPALSSTLSLEAAEGWGGVSGSGEGGLFTDTRPCTDSTPQLPEIPG